RWRRTSTLTRHGDGGVGHSSTRMSHPFSTLGGMAVAIALTEPSAPPASPDGPARRRTAAPKRLRGARPPANLVTRLRGSLEWRPRVDRRLAGGLRSWLEDDVATLEVARRRDPSPLMVDGSGEVPPEPLDRLRSAMTRVLFRQWVMTGSIDDPWH